MSLPTTPDALVAYILGLLEGSSSRPSDLTTIVDHDLLPYETDELPVAGVYLAEDKFSAIWNDLGWDQRIATIRVEIRAIGPMLTGTTAYRAWVKAILLQDQTFGGIALATTLASFQPFGMASNEKLAGADLDFEVTYLDFTEQSNG